MRLIAGIAAAALMLVLPGMALGQGDPRRGEQWGLDMVEAEAAHGVSRGSGAVVAVIDSGVAASHPDLGGRLLGGRDFVDGDGTPQDGNGHGTHVSGIVAANAGNGVGVSSVAPGARVLPVRVLGNDGSGSSGAVAAGIDWAAANGAHVINLSLGEDVPLIGGSSEFAAAIARALDRGLVVVAAAGNNGLPACEQPAAEARLLCVGAVDRRGMRSFFSSFGRGLGVVAPGGSGVLLPGEDILSTARDGGYEEMAGTSQAAPHVTGVAALLVAKGLRGKGVADRIIATARDAGTPGPDPQYGAGIVNARAALSGLPAGGGADTAWVYVPRVQRLRVVLRRGLRVRCRATRVGRCRAAVSRRKRRLAYGSRRLRANRATSLRARANPRGRRALRKALRRRKRIRVSVRVTVPGARAARRVVALRP